MGSGVRQSIGYKEIRNILIPLPPSFEQDQIVRYLDWQTSCINKLINAKKKQIILLEEKKRSFVFYAATFGMNKNRNISRHRIYWLEKIPEDWNILNIGQLFYQVKNKNIGLKEQNLLSLSYGMIKRRDIDATEGLLPDNFEGYNIIENNDIVLRLTDLQNDQRSLRTGLATERGIVTSAYLTIRNHSDNSSEYLQLFLHAFDLAKGFYNIGASGVRQNLNWDSIKKLKALIPPRQEQDEIVCAVRDEYAKVETAIDKLQQQIDMLAEYRNRIISDVVTGQVDVREVVIPEYETVEEFVDTEEESLADELESEDN